jgi:hypothetical protein
MTWSKSVLPDEALDPDCLVARLLAPRPYRVQLSNGSFDVYAHSNADAASTALELADPGSSLIGVHPLGEW